MSKALPPAINEPGRQPIPVLLYILPETLLELYGMLRNARGPRREAFAPLIEQLMDPGLLLEDELPDLPADVIVADADGRFYLVLHEVAGEIWLAPFSADESTALTRSKPDDQDGSTAVGMFHRDGPDAQPRLPLRAVGVWQRAAADLLEPMPKTPPDESHFPVLQQRRIPQ